LLAALIFRTGIAPLPGAISTLGLLGLLAISLIHLPIVGLLGTAWWMIARDTRPSGVWQLAWARALRDAGAEALPFSQLGGYVIGARALTLLGADERSALTWTFLDLLIEFGAKLPYMLFGLALLEFLRPGPAIAGALALCVAATVSLIIPQMRTRLLRFVPRLFRAETAGMASRPKYLRRSFGLHLVCWILGAGETWLIFRLMHAGVGLGPSLVVDSLVGAIRAASFFVPAAIGVQEGGYVLLCGLFGISPAVALAFSFARRARDLVIAIPILASWQWRETRMLLANPPRPGSF
jgi:glycosyltransferase 2 family protein